MRTISVSRAVRTVARAATVAVVPAVAVATLAITPTVASAAPAASDVRSVTAVTSASWRLQGWYADLGLCMTSGAAYVRGGAAAYRCNYLSAPRYPKLPWELDLLY